MGSIQYVPIGEDSFRCTIVTTAKGESRFVELMVKDVEHAAAPVIEGDDEFRHNDALMGDLLNYGVNEFAYRRGDDEEKRTSFRKAAERYSRDALQLAEYVTLGWYQTRRGWCSSCFELTEHREVDGKSWPEIHLCTSCGEAMTPCPAPGCRHMSRRPHGVVQVPPYCAEHSHAIRSFTRADEHYDSLDSMGDLRRFDRPNLQFLTRAVVVAGVGAAVIAPLAFVAAPAIGGAIGASGILGSTLSGAAATSHGLAFLGGGALAAGGLGMAGGTAVIAATGGALGGALGAVTATAYLQDDKSFRIEKLRGGVGAPVLIASGFLTQNDTGWGPWQRIIDGRYEHRPVYRVHWGAKELASFGALLGAGGGKAVAMGALKALGAKANKAGARVVPGLGIAVAANDAIMNPWHVAVNRANQTAAVLADVLARIEAQSFTLVGHSLGARVMLKTAELLATKGGTPRLESVHLLGAAAGTGNDWRHLNASVTGNVWNYHSDNDQVLGLLYRTAQAGSQAIGRLGVNTTFENIVNVDVSGYVGSHRAYCENVRLRADRSTKTASE